MLEILRFRQARIPSVTAQRFVVSRTRAFANGRNFAVLLGLDLQPGLFLVGSVGEHLQQHFAPLINPLDQNTGAFGDARGAVSQFDLLIRCGRQLVS